MTLPVGIITGTVTWGDLMNYAGIPLTSATVTLTPSADLTWSATGTALFRTPITVTGVTGSQALPATDQPGFVAGGVPVKDWSYTATISTPGQADRHILFQLPTAGQPGVSLDLDTLIPLDDSTPGTVVTVPSIISVNGQTGPTVTLTAASVGALPVGTGAAGVGALPAEAPAQMKNTAGNTTPFSIRNTTDTANILALSSGGTLSLTGAMTANAAVTGTVNGMDAVVASGTLGGIRFGSTAGQTYIARQGAQVIGTDSILRVRAIATASRPAATVGVSAMYYDTTLGKPVWSDGTNWRDAAGTIV